MHIKAVDKGNKIFRVGPCGFRLKNRRRRARGLSWSGTPVPCPSRARARAFWAMGDGGVVVQPIPCNSAGIRGCPNEWCGSKERFTGALDSSLASPTYASPLAPYKKLCFTLGCGHSLESRHSAPNAVQDLENHCCGVRGTWGLFASFCVCVCAHACVCVCARACPGNCYPKEMAGMPTHAAT